MNQRIMENWSQQFTERPDNLTGVMMITCTHPVHGAVIYYLTTNQFQDNIRSLIVPFWINNFTVIIQPCDGF
jgi:hypothetical protein